MAEFLIEAVGLSKQYGEGDQEIHVLNDLSLTVRPTERIAIIGESGVGKSTLLHILGMLDQPNSGQVLLDGEDLFTRSEAEQAAIRNREIGFIFQFHHLLPDFTALENVIMPGLIGGLSWTEARQRAETMLISVGLADRSTHRPGELSGGEQQRVAVARALVMKPRLILADEPTGNLDPVTGDNILRLLLDLNEQLGITMAVVTHNEKLAAAMDRTLRMQNGKLTEISQ
jgi:lipoprotein-releasing system ATP-binding protein